MFDAKSFQSGEINEDFTRFFRKFEGQDICRLVPTPMHAVECARSTFPDEDERKLILFSKYLILNFFETYPRSFLPGPIVY